MSLPPWNLSPAGCSTHGMATLLNVLGIHEEFTLWPNPPNAGSVAEDVGFAERTPAEQSQCGIMKLSYDGQTAKGGVAPVDVHNGMISERSQALISTWESV